MNWNKIIMNKIIMNKNVTLDVQYRHLNGLYGDPLPKGVTLDGNKSKTLLAGKATEGKITLTAANDAPPTEKQQIAVMANVSLNFVMKATYSSKPITVTVLPKAEEKADDDGGEGRGEVDNQSHIRFFDS